MRLPQLLKSAKPGLPTEISRGFRLPFAWTYWASRLIGIGRVATIMTLAVSVVLAACSLPAVSPSSNSNSSSPSSPVNAKASPPCTVNAVKICQDNARDRPALFLSDAVKGQSAANPSNLVAFAASLQLPRGPELKIACYYRPGTMAVVYARAWALIGGKDLVDLNPGQGQALNSPAAPTGPPLSAANYDYLRNRGYCSE
jgi:hypothetical protein